jgi:NAD(P)-dependent dehydrogenase (short-subunit alcohol dehydrogenase family)
VNAVAPRVVDAGPYRQRLAEGDCDTASITERLALGRFQTAREVADVVAFLFSPAKARMAGETCLPTAAAPSPLRSAGAEADGR